MLFSGLVPFSLFTANTEPSARAGEYVGVHLATDHPESPESPQKLEYWSGEPLSVSALFDASASSDPNAGTRVRLKIKKSQYFTLTSGIPDPDLAGVSGEQCDPAIEADFWCREYLIDMSRAIKFEIPVTGNFKNGVTPNGTQTKVQWAAYRTSDESLIQEKELTLSARTAGTYEPAPFCAAIDQRNLQNNPTRERKQSCVGEFEVKDPETVQRTTSSGNYVRFAVNALFRAAEESQKGYLGAELPETKTVIIEMPQGFEWDQSEYGSDKWTWDQANRRLTLREAVRRGDESSVDEVYSLESNCSDSYGRCPSVTMKVNNLPIWEDAQKTTPKKYTVKAQIILNEGKGDREITLPEVEADYSFVAKAETIPPGPVAQESILFEAKTDLIHTGEVIFGYPRYHSRYSDDNWYKPIKASEADAPSGQWRVELRNFSTPSGAPVRVTDAHTRYSSVLVKNLDPRLYFHSFTGPYTWYPSSDINRQISYDFYSFFDHKYGEEALDVINEFRNRKVEVIGVKADGSEVVLDEDVNPNDPPTLINDESRQFTQLKVKFTPYLELSDQKISFYVGTLPTAQENAEWKRGFRGTEEGYESTLEVAGTNTPGGSFVKDVHVKKASGDSLKIESSKAYLNVNGRFSKDQPVQPFGWAPNTNVSFVYSKCDGDPSTWYPAYDHAAVPAGMKKCGTVGEFVVRSGIHGPWVYDGEKQKNLTHLVLIPEGVEYLRTIRTVVNGAEVQAIEPVIKPNYKGTGKTALLYRYGDVAYDKTRPREQSAVYSVFHLRMTSSAKSPIDKTNPHSWDSEYRTMVDYFGWVDNSTKVLMSSADLTDLNDNGSRDDYISRANGDSFFVQLAKQLSVFKQTSHDLQTWVSHGQAVDIGQPVYFKTVLKNRQSSAVDKAVMLDVLPALNDHMIVRNAQHSYAPRVWTNYVDGNRLNQHSAFTVPLSESPEGANLREHNTEILNKFDLFYTKAPQGNTLENSLAVPWLTAAENGDGHWGEVTAIKLVLKPGQKLAAGESLNFVTAHTMPESAGMNTLPKGSRAVSSTAFIGNDDLATAIETNGVTVSPAKYTVSGTYFIDKDGNYTLSSADQKLDGKKVVLFPAGSDVPVAETITKNGGQYHFEVARRGQYMIRFAKDPGSTVITRVNPRSPVSIEKCATNSEAYAEANPEVCEGGQRGKVATFWTPPLNVSPDHLDLVHNVGLKASGRNVAVKKISDPATPSPLQANAPLANAEFAIKWKAPLDGETALDPVPVIPNQKTQANGIAQWTNVPFGKYTVTEVAAPKGYHKSARSYELIVEPKATTGSVDLEVVNTPITATVKVVKVDAENVATKLPNAVFTLKNDTVEYTSTKSDAKGIATFEGVLAGTYTLSEKTSPEGYILSSTTRQVVVADVHHGGTIAVGNFVNHKNGAQVSGVAIEKGKPTVTIAGAKFGLFKPGSQGTSKPQFVVPNLTTQDGRFTFGKVPAGSYVLRTITVPEGWELETKQDTPVNVTAGTDITNLQIEFSQIKARVLAKKVVAGSGEGLPGATFKLFKKLEDGTFEEASSLQAMSQADGSVTFTDVPYGTYQLKETVAPGTHILNTSDVREVVVNDREDKDLRSVPFTNEPKPSSVSGSALQGDSSDGLAGVTVELKKAGQSSGVVSPATGAEGTFSFSKVAPGEYELSVKSIPAGWKLKPGTAGTLSFSVAPDSTVTGKVFRFVRVAATVTVEKVDAADNGVKLAGAVFELRQNGAVKYTSSTSTDQGIATFTGVVPGTYSLVERSAPTDYVLNVDQSKTVVVTNADDGKTIEFGQFPNTKASSSVSGEAVQFDRDSVKVSQVKVGIFPKGTVCADLQGVESVKPIQTTPVNGAFAFDAVPVGEYVLCAVSTPAGWELKSIEGVDVTVSPNTPVTGKKLLFAPIMGSVRLLKVDADNQAQPLNGVEFKLLKKTGTLIEDPRSVPAARVGRTDTKGMLVFADVPFGEYVLRETATLEGYVLPSAPKADKEIRIANQGQAVNVGTVSNYLKQVNLTGVAIERGKPSVTLPNAKFALYREGSSADAAPVYNMGTQRTGSDGAFAFENVKVGNYILRQVETPSGYQKSEDLKVKVDGNNNVSVTVPHDPITGNVRVIKVDQEKPALVLSGVRFGLFKVEGTKLADTPSYEAVTDGQGIANFTDVRFGEYKLKEMATLTNYVLSNRLIDVNVSEQGKTYDLGNFANEKILRSVKIRKIDADDNRLGLPGAVFELRHTTNPTLVFTSKPSAAQDATVGDLVFDNVEYGTYKLVETQAPKGFNLRTGVLKTVNITEPGAPIDLGTVENTVIRADILGRKVDAETKTALANAVFILTDESGKSVEVTSADDGSFRFENVRYGTYELREMTAPEGYNPAVEPITVNVTQNAVDVEVGDISNTRIRGSVVLTKVQAANNQPLQGAVFELINQDGDSVARMVSGEDGLVRFDGVLYGTYTLKETTPPRGYLREVKEWSVKIETEGQIVDLGKVFNSKPPAKVSVGKGSFIHGVLAKTGFDGVVPVSALILLSVGAVTLLLSRRRGQA